MHSNQNEAIIKNGVIQHINNYDTSKVSSAQASSPMNFVDGTQPPFVGRSRHRFATAHTWALGGT